MLRRTKNPFKLFNDFTSPFDVFDPFTLLGNVNTESGKDENGEWQFDWDTTEKVDPVSEIILSEE